MSVFKLQDEFSLLFALQKTDPVKRGDPSENELSKVALMPKSADVERIELKRYLSVADENLNKAKKSFSEKIEKLKKRALIVQREQEKLRKNLSKFNNFVKEKRLKVEEGNRAHGEEKVFQDSIFELIKDRNHQLEFLQKAKNILDTAVNKRIIFREYLQTVVEAEGGAGNRYKDIGELMKRCETLVVTRDEARKALDKLHREIAEQENALAEFKEAQNERILNLSSRQNSLQDALYQIQARMDSRQRLIDQEGKLQIEQ